MASGFQICCSNCSFKVDAWDDGNPYIVDHNGERRNFYHPDGESVVKDVRSLIKATHQDTVHAEAGRMGNESYLLCLDCAKSSCLDPDVDTLKCPKCGGTKLRDHMEVNGVTCPKCKKGTLEMSDGPMMVS